MNKQQEILRLERLVKELGDDSYTGPWLREQLPFIKAAIEGDIPVESRAATVRQINMAYESSIASAKKEAEKIISNANTEAAVIKHRAYAVVDRIKLDAISKLKECIFQIEK